MKFLSILALLIIVSSCAHNKIRKVRVGNRTLIERNDTPKENHSDYVSIHSKQKKYKSKSLVTEEVEEESVTETVVESDGLYVPTPEPQDTIPTDGASVDKKETIRKALVAEEHAKRSVLLFALSIAALFILFPVALFLYPAGWVNYAKSRRSKYNTPEGVEAERKALIAAIIFLVIIILLAALVLSMIFFF